MDPMRTCLEFRNLSLLSEEYYETREELGKNMLKRLLLCVESSTGNEKIYKVLQYFD